MVSKLPADFYRFIADTGFKTNAGTVRINHYMNLNMPETCKAPELFDPLNGRAPIRDTDSHESAYEASTKGMTYRQEEWRIMRKGQGFYECYVRLWNWLWDNQEQLRDSNDAQLNNIWMKFFEVPSEDPDWNPLQRMMNHGYFGYECLGFVANYLRYAGIVNFYEGRANGEWRRTFEIPVNGPKSVAAVDCIEWENAKHVAIIHRVDTVGASAVNVEICQSSTGGPRHYKGVTLTLLGRKSEKDATAELWNLTGDVPVTGEVWVRKRRGLS